MSGETKVWPMPVVMKDQMYLGQCVDFLSETTEKLVNLYDEANSK